ncbi:hypothetical protein BN9982_40027 [Mycobacterium tuberculosis]|nr:hypothetical protein BN9982_40027 [Mycobacterium tuberculosis]
MLQSAHRCRYPSAVGRAHISARWTWYFYAHSPMFCDPRRVYGAIYVPGSVFNNNVAKRGVVT